MCIDLVLINLHQTGMFELAGHLCHGLGVVIGCVVVDGIIR